MMLHTQQDNTTTANNQIWQQPKLVIGGIQSAPPVVLAPMAAITNPPFRLLCRELGAGLVVTEMFAAKELQKTNEKTRQKLDIREDEHPVSVQIFGKNPSIMARAAEVIAWSGADMVDINMGCPMRKVVGSGHGAALLRDPKKIYEIVRTMAEAVDIPVTAKIRAGWEDTNATDVAKAIEDAGGAAITIHGRTREDMFEGHPDLEVIGSLKRAVSIPIIGNGDVRDVASAQNMFAKTGCDGVMIARGCMGYPWVFRELAAAFSQKPIPEEPTLEERRDLILRHVELYVETYGVKRTTLEIRKHLLWYFKNTPGETALKRLLQGLSDVSAIHSAIDAAVEACQQHPEPVQYPRGLKKHPNRRQCS